VRPLLMNCWSAGVAPYALDSDPRTADHRLRVGSRQARPAPTYQAV